VKQYIAIIRQDSDGCYGVSFPDLPGVVTAGDTFEEALSEATEARLRGRGMDGGHRRGLPAIADA
jgi:HicB_like antitoxin of bacterial toxin-antitoxin system